MRQELQTIRNVTGQPEYVLLPIDIYQSLKDDIDHALARHKIKAEYEAFSPSDFIKNPIALARMTAKITQTELARRLNVTQAYISKIENDEYHVSDKLYAKVQEVLKKHRDQKSCGDTSQ